MHPTIHGIIAGYSRSVLDQVEDALGLCVTIFKRDLFPSLKGIDSEIPGAGFQYVVWVANEPKFPFPGWDFDAIARPMRYVPAYLASEMKFSDIARAVARASGGHAEGCLRAFCSRADVPGRWYEHLPLGTLARHPIVTSYLGTDLAIPLSECADVLVNPAEHDGGPNPPVPVISYPDALAGYFASRILGAQVLKRGGILERYMEAINKAYSEGIVYTFPEGSDPR